MTKDSSIIGGYSTTSPTVGLDLFHLYVALSQSAGRSTTRLLRDFHDRLFQATHESEFLAGDDRLEDQMERH